MSADPKAIADDPTADVPSGGVAVLITPPTLTIGANGEAVLIERRTDLDDVRMAAFLRASVGILLGGGRPLRQDEAREYLRLLSQTIDRWACMTPDIAHTVGILMVQVADALDGGAR